MALQDSGVDALVKSTIQCEPIVCGLDSASTINALNSRLGRLADDVNVSNFAD